MRERRPAMPEPVAVARSPQSSKSPWKLKTNVSTAALVREMARKGQGREVVFCKMISCQHATAFNSSHRACHPNHLKRHDQVWAIVIAVARSVHDRRDIGTTLRMTIGAIFFLSLLLQRRNAVRNLWMSPVRSSKESQHSSPRRHAAVALREACSRPSFSLSLSSCSSSLLIRSMTCSISAPISATEPMVVAIALNSYSS